MKPSHGSSPLSQDPVDPCRISEAYSAVLFDLVVLSQVTNTTKAIIGVNERVCVVCECMCVCLCVYVLCPCVCMC